MLRKRRNHSSIFKAKVALWPPFRAIARSPNWPSNSMSIRTRSHSGSASCSKGNRDVRQGVNEFG